MINLKESGLISPNPSIEARKGRMRFSAVFVRWFDANDWRQKKLCDAFGQHLSRDLAIPATVVDHPSSPAAKPAALLHGHNISYFRSKAEVDDIKTNPGWRPFYSIWLLNTVLHEINQGTFVLPGDWDQKIWVGKKEIRLFNEDLPSLGDMYEVFCGVRTDLKLNGEIAIPALTSSNKSAVTKVLSKHLRQFFASQKLDPVEDWNRFAAKAGLMNHHGDRLRGVVMGTSTSHYGDFEIEKVIHAIAQGVGKITKTPVTDEELAATLLSAIESL